MTKKLIHILWIIILMFFSFSTFLTNAETSKKEGYKMWIKQSQENLNSAKAKLDDWPPTQETLDEIKSAQDSLKIYQDLYDKEEQKEQDDITSSNFTIDTSLFSPWGSWLKKWDAKATINYTLWTIIQKLMIALWVVALFIMTIWAWYMIIYHWEDEFLSKWKNILIAWVTSLVIALSSYYLVNLVWYLLYK